MRVVGYWNKISDKLAKQGAMKNMYEGGRESGGGGGGGGGGKKKVRHILCYKMYKTLHGMKHHT